MKDSQNQNPALILWIMWGALFFTLFVYMFVLYMVINNAEGFEAPDPEMISTMRIAFGVVAVGEIGVIFLLRHLSFFSKLASGDIASISKLRGRYMTTCIVSWALSEAVAIYGFVLAMLTHQLTYYLVFFAPAVVLFLIFRPQLGRYEEEFDDQRPDETDAPVGPASADPPSSGSW